jgi:hypothetical protein
VVSLDDVSSSPPQAAMNNDAPTIAVTSLCREIMMLPL